jgi:uncharacterized protein (DUF2141 family)
MKGCKYWSLVFLSAAFAVIFSCARQAAPSGGPADVTPPKIVKSTPANSSLNFRGKRIEVTFDEFFVLENINEKFMISPPVKKKPEIFKKGKSLVIDFQEPLKDSTTYTLYFQDAVRDLNAGNAIPNFQFVFSTGNVLDSLSATGNVYNAMNLEAPGKTLILMHRILADSAPMKLLPDYIGLADINGGFRINNVREGIYCIYALQDKNSNKKFDLAEEPFAFMDSVATISRGKNYLPVVIKKDTVAPTQVKTVPGAAKKVVANTGRTNTMLNKKPEVPLIDGEFKLFIFTGPKRQHYLTSSSRKTANHLVYTLSLPPDSMDFEFSIPGTDRNTWFAERSTDRDTINIWLTDSSLYRNPIIKTLTGYPFTDSTGITKMKSDTINMRFTFIKPARGKETRSKYSVTTNISGGTIKPGEPIIITSETPFRVPDTSRIRLYETIKQKNIPAKYSILKDTLSARGYYLKTRLKEGATYLLITEAGAFGDVFGGVSDSTGQRFTVRTADSYGKLTMNISGINGPVIIQLLDEREKVMSQKRINKNDKIEFPLLERGKYRLRAIKDLNNDGKWTTGNFSTKLQPEPVSYYPGEIEIRVDFQIDQDWDLKTWNEKKQELRSKAEQ